MHTGDLGVLDDDGYLRLCGRRHDMVVRGGENVYPVEVENVLSAHPAVAAVGVVGVPDSATRRNLGRVHSSDGLGVIRRSPRNCASFTRVTLAGFKIPQYWYTLDELPLNSAGKVVRARLFTHRMWSASTVNEVGLCAESLVLIRYIV